MDIETLLQHVFVEGEAIAGNLLQYLDTSSLMAGWNSSPDDPPLVFIHGYCARGKTLNVMAQKLQHDGYAPYVLGYKFWHDLRDVQESVADELRRIDQEKTSSERISIVAHSMGSLLAVGASRGLADKLDKVICLGPPFGGTRKAKYGVGISSDQLLPGSQYLRDVVGDSLPETIEYHVVCGEFDVVVPPDRSILPYQQENIFYHFTDTGHWGLIGKRGYETVRNILQVDTQ